MREEVKLLKLWTDYAFNYQESLLEVFLKKKADLTGIYFGSHGFKIYYLLDGESFNLGFPIDDFFVWFNNIKSHE